MDVKTLTMTTPDLRGLWRGVWIGLAAAVAGVGVLTLGAGCEREGPAERAGEAVDEAVEDTGDAIEDATDVD